MAEDDEKPKPEGDGLAKPEDEGESPDVGSDPGTLRIRVFEGDRHVMIQFGKAIEQLNLTPEQAVGIAKVLVLHAQRVSAKRLIITPGGEA